MTTTAKTKPRAQKSTSPKAKSPTTARRKAAVVVAAQPVVENRRSSERTGFVDLLAAGKGFVDKRCCLVACLSLH